MIPTLTTLRRRVVLPLAAAVVASLVAGAPASAESPVPTTVTVDGSTVRLDWTARPEATAYLVVDDRSSRVLWRGTQTAAEVPAQAPTSMALLVVALTDQGSEPVAKGLATVPDATSGLTPLTAVTTDAGTTLAWGAMPKVDSYEVIADGRTLARTVALQAQAPATLGEKAAYEIHAQPEITGEITPTTIGDISYGVEITPPTTDAHSAPADAQPGDTLPAGVRTLTSSRTAYEAYIPMAHVDAPDTGSIFDCESGDGSDYWYSGDNRGVGYETGKYRTKAVARYDWPSASTFTSKAIAPTKRYKKINGTLYYDSQRTASGEGFDVRPVSNDGRFALTIINHSVGNPYCSAMNNIDYDNRQEVYQNGGHYFLGRHDRMPNHQLYRYDTYSDGTYSLDLVFNHPYEDPKCLNWLYPCAMWQYQYTR